MAGGDVAARLSTNHRRAMATLQYPLTTETTMTINRSSELASALRVGLDTLASALELSKTGPLAGGGPPVA